MPKTPTFNPDEYLHQHYPTVARLLRSAYETGQLDAWESRELDTFMAEAVPAIDGQDWWESDDGKAVTAVMDAADDLAAGLTHDRKDGQWPSRDLDAVTEKRRLGQFNDLQAALKQARHLAG